MAGVEPEGRKSRARLWIWIGVIAVVVVGLTVAVFWYTGEPVFCRQCHEMQAQVDGWSRGSHAKISCFACHSDPGPLGYLKAHVGDGLRDVWVHFTRHPNDPGKAYVPPARCLTCHVNPKGGTPAIPSTDHPPRTAYCPDCHKDTIHVLTTGP